MNDLSDEAAVRLATEEARELWNIAADEFNQWDALGQDEKDELVRAVMERRVAP